MWFDTVYTIWMGTCLDSSNSDYFDPIKLKSVSNTIEDVQIGIDVLDGDELIGKFKIWKIIM